MYTGLISPEKAKKRWKSLKDTFSKVIAEEKKTQWIGWKHKKNLEIL